MVEKNNLLETAKNLPKFLMIKFDDKGQPMGARPMKDPSNLPKFINVKFDEEGNEKGQIYSFVEPVSPSNLVINKDFIRKLLIFALKNNESLRQEIRQSSYLLDQKIENFEKWSSLQNEQNQAIREKLGTLSISLNDLVEKMDQIKDINLLGKKLEDLNSRISSISKELTGNKTHEIEILQILRSFSDRISTLSQEVQNQNNELFENQRQMKEDLLVNQDKFHKNITNEVSKIKKMLRKIKKRIIKPQKAKVIRFLKEKFNFEPLTKVLVVTDKRNSVFGNILYESVRKLTENSIFVVTENRKGEAILDNPVVEAIKQSNYVFLIGRHSKIQIKEISGMLMNQVKIMSIKITLKYSIV
jgi:hypothetical protein